MRQKLNWYNLSINKYKEVVYEKIEYDPPSVIMAKIDEIDNEIVTLKEELKTLLNLDLVRLALDIKVQGVSWAVQA